MDAHFNIQESELAFAFHLNLDAVLLVHMLGQPIHRGFESQIVEHRQAQFKVKDLVSWIICR